VIRRLGVQPGVVADGHESGDDRHRPQHDAGRRGVGIVCFAALHAPSGDITSEHRCNTEGYADQQPTGAECDHAQDQRSDTDLVSGCVGVTHVCQF
jgi:hypothetical protein